MYRRDYILHLIEQLGRVLLQLRDRILRRERDQAGVRESIHEVASRAGIDLDVARSVDVGTLQLLLSFAGELDPARCWLTAELLYLEGLEARQDGDAAAARRDLGRARELYALLEQDWRPFEELPAVGERLSEIEELVSSA